MGRPPGWQSGNSAKSSSGKPSISGDRSATERLWGGTRGETNRPHPAHQRGGFLRPRRQIQRRTEARSGPSRRNHRPAAPEIAQELGWASTSFMVDERIQEAPQNERVVAWRNESTGSSEGRAGLPTRESGNSAKSSSGKPSISPKPRADRRQRSLGNLGWASTNSMRGKGS